MHDQYLRLIEVVKVFSQYFAVGKVVPSLNALYDFDFLFILNNGSDYDMKRTWNKRLQTAVEKLGTRLKRGGYICFFSRHRCFCFLQIVLYRTYVSSSIYSFILLAVCVLSLCVCYR